MRYWFDTEFIERPCTIDLISIGIVAEDGREFYAESSEVDWGRASMWVLENVEPHLTGRNQMLRRHIGESIKIFVGPDQRPEFWAYFGAYDWVAFCWLFGSMFDLPKGWPMFCRDVIQWCKDLGNPKLPAQAGIEHHALADAKWTREAWEYLAKIDRLRRIEASKGDCE